MVFTIFQPTFITLVLTLKCVITGSCYGAETNSRTSARINFFINIDTHNIVLQKERSRSQLNLLDFYNKHIIGRLSVQPQAARLPSTSFCVGTSSTALQHNIALPFAYLKSSFLLESFSPVLTLNGNIYCLAFSIFRQWKTKCRVEVRDLSSSRNCYCQTSCSESFPQRGT